MANLISLSAAFFLIFFIIWNNWPDLVERIGIFLVAHSQAIKSRKNRIIEINKQISTQEYL